MIFGMSNLGAKSGFRANPLLFKNNDELMIKRNKPDLFLLICDNRGHMTTSFHSKVQSEWFDTIIRLQNVENTTVSCQDYDIYILGCA